MTKNKKAGDNRDQLEVTWEVSEMDMVPFCFEGLALKEACWLEGKPYFTARAIGDFLEYSDPVVAIRKVILRNPHIDDPRWSVLTSLVSTDGKKYRTKIYDPIGLQLIIFESQQPKAIQFKVAAAHLVYSYMRGELKPSKWVRDKDLLSAARQILSLPHGLKRSALIQDLADQQNCSKSTAYRRIIHATGERLKTTKGNVIHRRKLN